jgi:hypothetical protein
MGATGGEYGLAINHTPCIIGIVADSISCTLQSLACAHSLQRECHILFNSIRTYLPPSLNKFHAFSNSPAWMGPNQPSRIAGECRVCTKNNPPRSGKGGVTCNPFFVFDAE